MTELRMASPSDLVDLTHREAQHMNLHLPRLGHVYKAGDKVPMAQYRTLVQAIMDISEHRGRELDTLLAIMNRQYAERAAIVLRGGASD